MKKKSKTRRYKTQFRDDIRSCVFCQPFLRATLGVKQKLSNLARKVSNL